MKHIIPPLLLTFVLYSCGNAESQEKETSESQNETVGLSAEQLLDSANAMIGEFGLSPEATSLVTRAIVQDPQNKRAYQKLISIHTAQKNHEELKKALKEMNQKFPHDPYSKLHLAMETELQSESDEFPLEMYSDSFDSFLTVMDTLASKAEIVRQGYILNAALSARLANMDKDQASDASKPHMASEELAIFENIFMELENSEREELLNVRRN